VRYQRIAEALAKIVMEIRILEGFASDLKKM